MKCKNCGAELNDDSIFCSYCGAKLEQLTELHSEDTSENLKNKSCEVQDETGSEMYDESLCNEIFTTKVTDKKPNIWSRLSKLEKAAVIFAAVVVVACAGAFKSGRFFAGTIAVVQIAMLITAVLINKGIIKTKKGKLPTILLILAAILSVAFLSDTSEETYHHEPVDVQRLEWNSIVLSEVIPEPKSDRYKITTNSQNKLQVTIYNVSPAEFSDYIKQCIDAGFTVDAEQSDDRYLAYKDNYKLSVVYYEYDKTMDISVTVSEKLGSLKWPDSGLAALIPAPKSTIGEIETNNEKVFVARVGEISKPDYKAYVDMCIDAGFSIDISRNEKSFTAKNKDSNKLSVEYEGNSIISIKIYEPEYDITLEVECGKNLIFSKYDIELYIDDSYIGDVEHGAKKFFSETLKKGNHVIRVENAEDSDVFGDVIVDVSGNDTMKLKVSCWPSSIDIDIESKNDKTAIVKPTADKKDDEKTNKKQINADEVELTNSYFSGDCEDVVSELKEMGFTNIKTKPVYDVTGGWLSDIKLNTVGGVTIDKKTDYSTGDVFRKDVEVVVTSRQYVYSDPNIKYESYTVSQLAKDWDSNEIRAKETHRGQYVAVTGYIESIDKNAIQLKASNDVWSTTVVVCSIQTDEQLDQAKALSAGEKITIKGRIILVNTMGYFLDIYQIS